MSEAGPIISVAGEKIALGPVRREHVPLWERWINDVAVAASYFRGDLTPDPPESLSDRYDRMRKDVVFTIYERATMRPIGLCDLSELNHFNHTADFGILIGEKECWGRGYGTEATRLTLDWAFTCLGLHNVLLTVFSYNERGLGAYRRAGFKEIGRRREAKRLAGKAYDVIYMDCLSTEFTGSVLRPVVEPR